MATFRDHLPSRREIWSTFAVIVVMTHAWAIFSLSREIPALVMYMTYWELAGAAAYTLSFALLESILVLLAAVALAIVFPVHLLRDRAFASMRMMVGLATVVWVTLLYGSHREESRALLLALCVAGYVLSLFLSYRLALGYKKNKTAFLSFLERITVLSAFYILIDLIAVLIVVVRNVF